MWLGREGGGVNQRATGALSNVEAAHESFPHWSQKNRNTSLFIIISYCVTVRVSNQLAFRVRRAAT